VEKLMSVCQWWIAGWGKSLGFMCFLLMVGTVAAQWRQPETPVVETLPTGRIDWTAGLVYSTGRVPAAGGEAVPATPVEAARETARQQLHQTLVQLQLDAARTVGSVMQTTGETQQRLAILVAHAEVIETRYLPRGAVESTIQMPLFGQFTALLWPAMTAQADTAGLAGETVHTGIIIDARGLAVHQALFPQVFDEEGRTLYAPTHVRAEMAQQRGYMVYATAFDSPQIEPRVGKNPLVLRARRVADGGRVNLIMHQADALQLQRFPALQTLLSQCRVVIVS
jgi:hypothetical protein